MVLDLIPSILLHHGIGPQEILWIEVFVCIGHTVNLFLADLDLMRVKVFFYV